MILGKIGVAAMYEQLAEEGAELTKAALKMARILRGENPTPLTIGEAMRALHEEVTDVQICLDELALEPVKAVRKKKLFRFQERWREWIGNKGRKESQK